MTPLLSERKALLYIKESVTKKEMLLRPNQRNQSIRGAEIGAASQSTNKLMTAAIQGVDENGDKPWPHIEARQSEIYLDISINASPSSSNFHHQKR